MSMYFFKNSFLSALFLVILAIVLYLLDVSILDIALFAIGAAVGLGLLIGDILFFQKWYQLPEPFSRTFLFLIVYIPLLIFAMTSSGSYLAIGCVLAIGLSRLFDFIQYLLQYRRESMSQKAHIAEQNKSSSTHLVPSYVLSGGKKSIVITELSVISIVLFIVLLILLIRIIV